MKLIKLINNNIKLSENDKNEVLKELSSCSIEQLKTWGIVLNKLVHCKTCKQPIADADPIIIEIKTYVDCLLS